MNNGKNILIIDDDDELVEALTMILETKQFNISRAANGKSGLEVLKKHVPDLIILDIMMDTVDEGINVAREIRKNPEWKNIPIMGLSSINNEYPLEIGASDELYPVNTFLEKPVSPQRFISEIEKLL